jgi:ankyrin repeat protein
MSDHRLRNSFNGVPTQEEVNEFCNAAKSGNIDTVTQMLDRYGPAIIDQRDQGKDTALTWAAWTGQAAIITLLLERGAAIDEKGMRGKTALAWAAEGGKNEVVRLLLENGASTEPRDEDGKTALTLARERSHTEVVQQIEQWSEDRQRKIETQKQRAIREKEEEAARAVAQDRLQKLKLSRPPKIRPRK